MNIVLVEKTRPESLWPTRWCQFYSFPPNICNACWTCRLLPVCLSTDLPALCLTVCPSAECLCYMSASRGAETNTGRDLCRQSGRQLTCLYGPVRRIVLSVLQLSATSNETWPSRLIGFLSIRAPWTIYLIWVWGDDLSLVVGNHVS